MKSAREILAVLSSSNEIQHRQDVSSSAKRQHTPNRYLCDCTTPEAKAKLEHDLFELAEEEKENVSTNWPGQYGPHWGRSGSGFVVPARRGQKRKAEGAGAASSVPASPFSTMQAKMRDADGYYSPSKTEPTEFSENGSVLRRRTLTPRAQELVRIVKVKLTWCENESSEKKEEIFEFYQTASAAATRKKIPVLSEKDLKKAEEKCPEPTSFEYVIELDAITVERLKVAAASPHKISDEHKGVKASAIGANADVGGALEHSHMEAHRHGQALAVARDGKDHKRTFPARREHNTLRLITAEIPAIAECIKILEVLYFSVKTTLLDKDGKPVPIIKCEEITWEDKAGNKICFKYDALKQFTPVHQLENFSKILVEHTFLNRKKRRRLSFGPLATSSSSSSSSSPSTSVGKEDKDFLDLAVLAGLKA